MLVIAAHPDDEVLGCGGTIARHSVAGDQVDILFVSDGEGSRVDAGELDAREDAARAAAQILGAHPPEFLRFPDNQLDSVPLLDVAKAIEQRVSSIKPNVVYTHFAGDLNLDHRRVLEAALIACRPLPGNSVTEIHAFEILSSTEWGRVREGLVFSPSLYIDIAPVLERKIQAIHCYDKELRPAPHPRSINGIRALSSLRGSEAGLEAAEAYVTLRQIRKGRCSK